MLNVKRGRNIIILVALTALVALTLLLPSATGVASAADGDAFDVVFPLRNYFQSLNPTLISANGGYLIVYDGAQKALYVRSETRSTYRYDLSALDDVSSVLAVGSHALMITGAAPNFTLYSLDLTDTLASPEQKETSTPENISYFASDGTYLYAKNDAGNLSVYDEQLQIALGVDNLYNYEVLAGKANLAGEEGNIYLFYTDEKSSAQMSVFDSEQNRIIKSTPSLFIQSAHIGEVIYAQISPDDAVDNHNKIVLLDKESGEQLSASEIEPDCFCAYKDTLYAIIGNRITVYRLHKESTDDGVEYSLSPDSIISMAGNDRLHLDKPTDVTGIGDRLYVADSMNNRIAILGADEGNGNSLLPYDLSGRPIRLTDDGKSVYALLDDGTIVRLIATSDGVEEDATGYSMQGATDILYHNTLYALTESGLYAYLGSKFTCLADDLSGAKRIVAAKDGSGVYVLSDSEIYIFDGLGNRIASSLTGDFTDVVDFTVDYAGNFILLYADRAERYINRITSMQITDTKYLTSSSLTVAANSAYLNGDKLYFSADECLIGVINDVDSVSKDDFVSAIPRPTLLTEYHFARLAKDVSYCLPADGRADGATIAPTDTLLVLDGISAPDGLSYALSGSNLVLIPDVDFETVAPTYSDGTYLVKSDTVMHHIPYFEGISQNISAGTTVSMISDCAGYDGGKWNIVEYNDVTYFIDAGLIEKYSAPPVDPSDPDSSDDEKQLFGRAKADRVGGVVKIYSDMTEQTVLTDIVDGKRVEILYDYGAYYKIKYGDMIGFMRRAEVKVGGLTTVQIIAIVLAVVVLIAGTGIFISIHEIKKRQDSENA